MADIDPILAKSAEYRSLCRQEQKLAAGCRELAARATEAADHPKHQALLRHKTARLQQIRNKISRFKHDIAALAQQFARTQSNSTPLRQAKQHFENGQFREAYAALTRAIAQGSPSSPPEHPDRFAGLMNVHIEAEQWLEQAKNFHEHHQDAQAESYYAQALARYRTLASADPQLFGQTVAEILNSLANVVSKNPANRARAEQYYTEAVAVLRDLAAVQPHTFEQDIAGALNNLAFLIAKDASRRAEAVQYYAEALTLCRNTAAHTQEWAQYEQLIQNNLDDLKRMQMKFY